MTDLLADILSLSREALHIGFAVFLRVGAMAALAPAMGETSVPARIKLVIAFAMTGVVAPAVSEPVRSALQSQPVGTWLLFETLIGLSMGAVLRFFIAALQIAGTIAAQASSLSQLFGGSAGEPQPAIGNLLVVGAIALATTLGLHVRLAEFLIGSYEAFPPAVPLNPAFIRSWGVSGVSRAFALAFTLAAPFVIAGLIYNVALGAINRAMPQLMVAFVGAPALTAGGLILLAASASSALVVWHEALSAFIAAPLGGM